jgi:hypothetical protein
MKLLKLTIALTYIGLLTGTTQAADDRDTLSALRDLQNAIKESPDVPLRPNLDGPAGSYIRAGERASTAVAIAADGTRWSARSPRMTQSKADAYRQQAVEMRNMQRAIDQRSRQREVHEAIRNYASTRKTLWWRQFQLEQLQRDRHK